MRGCQLWQAVLQPVWGALRVQGLLSAKREGIGLLLALPLPRFVDFFWTRSFKQASLCFKVSLLSVLQRPAEGGCTAPLRKSRRRALGLQRPLGGGGGRVLARWGCAAGTSR